MSRFTTVRLLGMMLASLFAAGCGGGGSGGPSQPQISAEAPAGTTGVAYSAFAFTVMSGGTAPFTWSETGPLPPGLSLSSSGQLSGTPTRAGTFPISVMVTDSSNPPLMNSVPVNLKIADSPILISAAPAPPDGTAACPYAGFTFMASGGSPGYTWAVTAGSLPAGMALIPNGSLAGTPAAAGPFTFTVTATDSAQTPQAKSQRFNVSVSPPLATPLDTPVMMLGNGAFWIPYRATPANASCGPTGVFVIPSDALTTAPAYVTASANTMSLASGQNVTVNAGNVITAHSPATLIYAATDTNNNIHVYGLNLLAAQTPAATQISSLSLPLAPGTALNTVICDSHGSSSNLLQPTTLFAVLHIAGTTGCNTKGDVWEVVHYTDSSATAPTVVSITTTNIQELYAPSGARTGLLLLDPASNNLYVYANDNFTAPATAIAGGGIGAVGTVYSNNNMTASGTAFTGTVLFLAVTTAGGLQHLYRLPYTSATATHEYTAVGGLGNGVSDGTNLYFTDNGSPQLILQEPLAGGPPIKLYSYTVPAESHPYSLVGSNGSLLVMGTFTEEPNNPPASYLATLPVGTPSANTTSLETNNGFTDAFMVETTPGTASTALVFVNSESVNGMPGPPPPTYSSEVLTPSGAAKIGVIRNSAYDVPSGLSGYVMQITGLQVQNRENVSISAINLETLAATGLSNPTGATLPIGLRPFLVSKSNLIGAGSVGADGLAFDLSKDLIVPIIIANSNVAPF
jgi:hypothetical protein